VPTPLAPGTYENTRPLPAPSGFPGLTVNSDLTTCDSTSNGRFLLDQIAFDGGGALVNFSARFEFHCDGGDPAVFGAVSYHGTSPVRTVTNDSTVAFGNVFPGNTSAPQVFTLTNNGPATLTFGAASITGTDGSQFSITDDTCSGNTIAVSASCSVTM